MAEPDLTTVYEVGWHSGFGGMSSTHTLNPIQFRHQLHEKFGHLDYFEIAGAGRYTPDKMPGDIDQLPSNTNPPAQKPPGARR